MAHMGRGAGHNKRCNWAVERVKMKILHNSNNFTTTDGTIYWTEPSDWSVYSVNGSTDLYYIRTHLETGSFSTDPIESFIKTDILLSNTSMISP